MFDQICLVFCQIWACFGQVRARFGQDRSGFDEHRTAHDRIRAGPICVRLLFLRFFFLWPLCNVMTLARLPMLAKFGSPSTTLRPISKASSTNILAKLGPSWSANIVTTLVPSSNPARIGQIWPQTAKFAPMLAELGSNVGQRRPGRALDQIWPHLAGIGRGGGEFGSILGKCRPTSTCLGQPRPN